MPHLQYCVHFLFSPFEKDVDKSESLVESNKNDEGPEKHGLWVKAEKTRVT